METMQRLVYAWYCFLFQLAIFAFSLLQQQLVTGCYSKPVNIASHDLFDGLLEPDPDHGDRKRVPTPSPAWEAGKDAKICYRCREPGHITKDCNVVFD